MKRFLLRKSLFSQGNMVLCSKIFSPAASAFNLGCCELLTLHTLGLNWCLREILRQKPAPTESRMDCCGMELYVLKITYLWGFCLIFCYLSLLLVLRRAYPYPPGGRGVSNPYFPKALIRVSYFPKVLWSRWI